MIFYIPCLSQSQSELESNACVEEGTEKVLQQRRHYYRHRRRPRHAFSNTFFNAFSFFKKLCPGSTYVDYDDDNNTKPKRTDLRHLKSYAIDDTKTKVVDDAIALDHENEDDCWVFITDPTVSEKAKSISTLSSRRLDKEYVLSHLSLDAKEFSGAVMAYKFQNGLRSLSHVTLAIIRKPIRYTPQETARMISEKSNDGEDLRKLLCVSEIRKKSCCENVSSNEIKTLVQRFMVTTNSFAALFARDNRIPFIYRTQNSRGDAAQYDSNPAKHDCLDVDAYAQVTSPLRRWSDFVNHSQIVSFIKNLKYTFDAEKIEKEVEELQEARLRRSKSLL